VRLGVIAALSQELGPTLTAIQTSTRVVDRLQIHDSPSLTFAVGGVGSRPAAAAALLVADQVKPDALLSVGFCGALTDDLDTGDLVLGGSSQHPATESLLTLLLEAAPKARRGSVVTVARVFVNADEKRTLAKHSKALVVDMEADAVALAAEKRGLGFAAVKVVIDTPAAPLASTYTSVWSVLKDMILKPGSVMGMVYDSKRVTIAADRLKEFFLALKDRLPYH